MFDEQDVNNCEKLHIKNNNKNKTGHAKSAVANMSR